MNNTSENPAATGAVAAPQTGAKRAVVVDSATPPSAVVAPQPAAPRPTNFAGALAQPPPPRLLDDGTARPAPSAPVRPPMEITRHAPTAADAQTARNVANSSLTAGQKIAADRASGKAPVSWDVRK